MRRELVIEDFSSSGSATSGKPTPATPSRATASLREKAWYWLRLRIEGNVVTAEHLDRRADSYTPVKAKHEQGVSTIRLSGVRP